MLWLLKTLIEHTPSRQSIAGGGFDMAKTTGIAHSCPMTIAENVREYAAEQGVIEQEALKREMEEKSKEFLEKGAEVYAKV